MQPDLTKLMPSTMISKRDYGIKIAKKGYDVNFASDTELLYNSTFPVLAIANYIDNDSPIEVLQEGQTTIWHTYDGTYGDTWIYSFRVLHGLDYVPLVVETNSDMLQNYGGMSYSWDSSYIYGSKSFNTAADYNSFVAAGKKIDPLLVFAVNIEVDVEYPYFEYAEEQSSWGSEEDYGLKYILNGSKDNLNLDDLGINPNIQSLMVYAVKVSDDTNKSVYIPSDIDFRNLTPFCFVKINGLWSQAGPSVQAVGGYRSFKTGVDTGYYTLDGLWFGDKVSLVTVRMPFISPDSSNYNVKM